MCLVPASPAAATCPASVSLLFAQIKDLPRAQQQDLLDQLHNHIYHPFYAVLVSGPDYRQPAAATL